MAGQAEHEPESGGGAQVARNVALHLMRLLGQALGYLWRTLVDLLDAARRALLLRSRGKFPDRTAQIDSTIAKLREREAQRWSSWGAVPERRRMEIRFAAVAMVVVAVLGARIYVTRGRRAPDQVAPQPAPADTLSASSTAATSNIAPSSAPAAPERSDAEQFIAQCKTAAPGQWIVYGVEPVEIARANLAAAQAQMKSAEAAANAAGNQLDSSMGQSSENAVRAAYRAANDERSKKEKAYAAAQAELNRAQHPIARPVLERGEVRDWDGFKVMSPVVMKEANRYRMWYVGCHFVGDDYTCGVGHAESRDGIIWRKSPGPVLTIEDPVVSQDLHSIAVVRTGDEYLMWYALDSNPLHGNDCAAINLATSKDGLAWKPGGLVLSANCQNAAHLWQSAFYDGKTIHLWYADYDSSANGSLMHLVSSDGKKWPKAGSTDIGTLGNDPRRLWVMPDRPAGYRALFAAPDQNGYFGILQSSDGDSWKIAGDAPKLTNLFSGGDDGKPEAPAANAESGGTWIWFAVPNTRDGSEKIALALHEAAAQ